MKPGKGLALQSLFSVAGHEVHPQPLGAIRREERSQSYPVRYRKRKARREDVRVVVMWHVRITHMIPTVLATYADVVMRRYGTRVGAELAIALAPTVLALNDEDEHGLSLSRWHTPVCVVAYLRLCLGRLSGH